MTARFNTLDAITYRKRFALCATVLMLLLLAGWAQAGDTLHLPGSAREAILAIAASSLLPIIYVALFGTCFTGLLALLASRMERHK